MPKLYFVPLSGARIRLPIPKEKHVQSVAPGGPCPFCGAIDYRVHGEDRHISEDDRAYESVACCCTCNKRVGTLRLNTDTLFGLHEDEMVLNGLARVY